MLDSPAPATPLVPQSAYLFTSRIPAAIFGGLLTLFLVGAGLWFLTGIGPLSLFRNGQTVVNVGQPTVVREIRELQRLETVDYTMDKIISGERNNSYLPKFLVGDRILLVVHGEVTAGLNLATVNSSDVKISGQNISIHLPAAEVFSTRIDNAKTRVYSRDTGLFSSPDPNLESQVREEAERQLQQAALQDGILRVANQNARTTISTMIKGLGFKRVDLE